jgi:hypothetical protein
LWTLYARIPIAPAIAIRAKNCDRQRDSAAFENGGKTVHDHLRKNIFSARIAALRFDAS